MRNLALGIMASWALIMLPKSKLMAKKLCILLTSIISLGVMQKLAFAVVGYQPLCLSMSWRWQLALSEPLLFPKE